MKNQTCCFTGHRTIPAGRYADLAGRLRKEIAGLIQQGVTVFKTGGALGFDTLAAQLVLEARDKYPQIKLVLILPCRDQTRGWRRADKERYEEIKNACDQYSYLSDGYTRDCMFQRDRRLVEDSRVCVCYLGKKTGGTAYTVRYARQKGLTVINLFP